MLLEHRERLDAFVARADDVAVRREKIRGRRAYLRARDREPEPERVLEALRPAGIGQG